MKLSQPREFGTLMSLELCSSNTWAVDSRLGSLQETLLRHSSSCRVDISRHRPVQFPGDRNGLFSAVLHVVHLPEARIGNGQARLIVRRIPSEDQDLRTLRRSVQVPASSRARR